MRTELYCAIHHSIVMYIQCASSGGYDKESYLGNSLGEKSGADIYGGKKWSKCE